MFNYTCLNPIAGVGLDLFSDDYKKVDDIKDADAALVRSAAMHDMELGDKVLAVARAGAGVNNIPLDKCAEQGIVVFNTPGANANGVKELVFAGMLYASRDIVGGIDWCLANQNDENIAKTAEKQKKNFAGTEISGKKLGVIGLGAIGVLVANAAVHMGMDVYGYDPYISVNAAWNLSRSVKHISNVEDIYKNCDVITIHVPLLDSTKKMINADAINTTTHTAILIIVFFILASSLIYYSAVCPVSASHAAFPPQYGYPYCASGACCPFSPHGSTDSSEYVPCR